MNRLSRWYGGVLTFFASIAGVLLFVMMLLICADVLSRNLPAVGFKLKWANEVSEYALYLITYLAAPWLLRRGQHVRVDLLLRGLPPQLAWLLEWLADAMGLAISVVILYHAGLMLADAWHSGALVLKELVFPEWWLLAPVPVAVLLLTLEFVFRMHRLSTGTRQMRDDVTSVS
jgi:TRAP-type C4-dicarboxylate transport system permease small subunit